MISKEELKQYIEKIERLEENKADISEDIKSVFEDAKIKGFDNKAMKQVLKLRKMDRDKLAEQDAMLDLYREIMGV